MLSTQPIHHPIGKPIYKWHPLLKPWGLSQRELCGNPHPYAFEYLEEYWNRIKDLPINKWGQRENILRDNEVEWFVLCKHPDAMPYLMKHWFGLRDQLDWRWICENPDFVFFLDKYWDAIVEHDHMTWFELCKNPAAIPLIQKHWRKIIGHVNMGVLFANPNVGQMFDLDIQICAGNLGYHSWTGIFSNPNAFSLLDKYWCQIKEPIYSHLITLCANPNAIPLFDKHWDDELLDKMCKHSWVKFSCNPNATSLLLKHLHYIRDKIDWYCLCKSPNAIPILMQLSWHDIQDIFDKLNWRDICRDPNAIPFLDKHWHHIQTQPKMEFEWKFEVWNALCSNPNAIPFLDKHLASLSDKLCGWFLGMNPNVLPLLEKHWHLFKNQYVGEGLCHNPNPDAIGFMEAHWDDLKNSRLSTDALCRNPNAIVLDKEAMRKQMAPFLLECVAQKERLRKCPVPIAKMHVQVQADKEDAVVEMATWHYLLLFWLVTLYLLVLYLVVA